MRNTRGIGVNMKSTPVKWLLFIFVLLGFFASSMVSLVFPLSVPSHAQQTDAAPFISVQKVTPFVAPGGTWSVELRTGGVPANAQVSTSIHGRVVGRANLERTIAGEQLGGVVTTLPSYELSQRVQDNRLTIAIPIAGATPIANAISLTEVGIYPVEILFSANNREVARVVVHLIRLPEATATTPPLNVSLVADIEEQLEIEKNTAVLTSEQKEHAEQLLALVANEGAAVPLSLSLSPFTLSQLQLSESTLTQLRNRDILRLPYTSVESGNLVAGGLGATLQESFQQGASTLRSLTGKAPVESIGFVSDYTTAESLQSLTQLGMTKFVVEANALGIVNDNAALTTPFRIETAQQQSYSAIANDIGAALQLLFGNDPVLRAQNGLAMLTMLAVNADGTGRNVALKIPSGIEAETLQVFLAGLTAANGSAGGTTGAPLITATALNDQSFTATTSSRVRKWTSLPIVPINSYADAWNQTQKDIAGLTSMFAGEAATGENLLRQSLTSANVGLSTADRLRLLNGVNQNVSQQASQVSLPNSQRIRLASSNGKIPIVLTNASSSEAKVRLQLNSPKLEFPQGATVDAVLPPSGTTTVEVAVSLRASGAFPLDVTLSSPDGRLTVATSRIEVRSTSISGFGLALSVGAGIFLAVWWIRHWRSSRKEKATA